MRPQTRLYARFRAVQDLFPGNGDAPADPRHKKSKLVIDTMYYRLLPEMKNALRAGKDKMTVPFSRMDLAVLEVLADNDYVKSVEKETAGKKTSSRYSSTPRKRKDVDFKLLEQAKPPFLQRLSEFASGAAGIRPRRPVDAQGIMSAADAKKKKWEENTFSRSGNFTIILFMSRLIKKPIALPEGVTITERGGLLTVKGPKGELSVTVVPGIVVTSRKAALGSTEGKDLANTAMLGTTWALVGNCHRRRDQGICEEARDRRCGLSRRD